MISRDNIYLSILYSGLCKIRSASSKGDIGFCNIEAIHLQGIPSLIGMHRDKEEEHRFYYEKRRISYLKFHKNHKFPSPMPKYGDLKDYECYWEDLREYLYPENNRK